MQLKIINSSKTEMGKMELPLQFSEDVRPDLIKRAFLVSMAEGRQPYGASNLAGKRASAKVSRRRRNYKGSYGKGISRVPRKVMSRNGGQFNWVGAFAPGTVGGRQAHPPKAEKIWAIKINRKERKKAIRSAIAATINKDLVKNHGHRVPEGYPFIIADDFEQIQKTHELLILLEKFGFSDELERASATKIRAGKGKTRGRKYQRKTGILIAVSKKCPLINAAKNLNIDVMEVSTLGVNALAPGGIPGRLTLFTESALKKMGENNTFM